MTHFIESELHTIYVPTIYYLNEHGQVTLTFQTLSLLDHKIVIKTVPS